MNWTTASVGFAFLASLFSTQFAMAQGIVVFGQGYYQPIAPMTMVVERPVMPAVAMQYAPPMVAVAPPTYAAMQPVVAQTTYVAQAPVVAPTNYVTAAPTVVYRPVVGVVPSVARFAPPVVVRSKYYVPGQPVRNIVKAVAP